MEQKIFDIEIFPDYLQNAIKNREIKISEITEILKKYDNNPDDFDFQYCIKHFYLLKILLNENFINEEIYNYLFDEIKNVEIGSGFPKFLRSEKEKLIFAVENKILSEKEMDEILNFDKINFENVTNVGDILRKNVNKKIWAKEKENENFLKIRQLFNCIKYLEKEKIIDNFLTDQNFSLAERLERAEKIRMKLIEMDEKLLSEADLETFYKIPNINLRETFFENCELKKIKIQFKNTECDLFKKN